MAKRLNPVVACLLGIALLSFMDAIIKGLVARLPVIEVAFLRYCVGSAVMIAICALRRTGVPTAETARANAIRAILVVLTATLFFTGLGILPLAEALILSFVSPLFTSLLAALVLKERLDGRVLGAIGTGFAGVTLIIVGGYGLRLDTSGTALAGAAAILVSTVCYSASNVLLRARAQRDPLLHIVLIQNVAPCLILLGPALYWWQAPSAGDAALLLAVGSLGVTGHLMLARAYAGAPASRLAPLDYTALIWAAGIGFLAFDEVPSPWAAGGAVLIGAGVFWGTRPRRVRRD